MAKKKKKTTSQSKTLKERLSFSLTKQQKIILGSFLMLFGLALLISFVSYLFNWQADQSVVGDLNRNVETQNWLSKFGSNIGHFFVYKGFGLAAFIFGTLVLLSGVYYFLIL